MAEPDLQEPVQMPADLPTDSPAVVECMSHGKETGAPWWAAPLGTWLASRLGMVILTFTAAWTVQSHQLGAVPSFTTLWNQWDVVLFRKAAEFGWFSPNSDPHQAVDFPGLPLAMRVVHPVVGSWVMTGIVVSLLAGVATSLALYRLAALDEPGGLRLRDSIAGRRAILYLIVFPYAVFLLPGYSEGLFLAFAVTSWLAARQGRWGLALVLAAGATATRVTGIAFTIGLAVEYIVSRRRAARAAGAPGGGSLLTVAAARRLLDRRAPLFVIPVIPVFAYLVYLHHNTGAWNSYSVAQRLGWGRVFAWPWHGWQATWHAAFSHNQAANYAWFWRAELLAVVVGVVLTIILAVERRWGEATYVGSNVILMTATNYYASGIRAVLVWFPLFLLLARLTQRRPWLHSALIWTMAPMMAAISIAFIGGAWVD